MSCCPPAPPIRVGAAADSLSSTTTDEMQPGEVTECYTATSSNPSGLHDDATQNVPDKIDTPTVPLDAEAKVNVTFRLQAGSTRTPTSWTFVDSSTGAAWSVPGVTFSGSGSTASLVGTFPPNTHGTKFSYLLTAIDGTGEIDSRTYVFSPALSSAGDSIRLQHPLPGSRVTSRFNPMRKHPVTGEIKAHKGTDFAYAGGKLGDVLAAADGVCMAPQYQAAGAGNYVKIVHKNSAGKHMCTTVYMHMSEVYVKEGQQVSAGTKIGREGNTGIGSGPHLHFECRLPNDARVDPEPLIVGSLEVARETTPQNTPVEASIETVNGNAVLTPSNVDAKTAGCNPYGSDYPVQQKPIGAPPVAPPPGVPSLTGDIFELAWDLTLKTECIGWKVTPPTVPTTLAGDISTREYQRACGYVNHVNDTGGETKFGISQKNNKNVNVNTIDYETARSTARANYWAGKQPDTLSGTKPRTAVALFNFGYLCGTGGANQALIKAQIGALDDVQSLDALCDQIKIRFQSIVIANPSQKVFLAGWFNRAELVRSYCKALS